MLVSKEQRTKIVDFLEKLCETSSMSKKTLGYTMRSYHVSCPFFLMLFLFYSPQWAVTIHAFNLMAVFVLFFLFNGCLLTMLEHRLCGDEYTIADPFIELFGLELNSKNRMIISYFIAGSYFVFFFMVYYYRFYFKKAKKLIKPVATIIENVVQNKMPSAFSKIIKKAMPTNVMVPNVMPTTNDFIDLNIEEITSL